MEYIKLTLLKNKQSKLYFEVEELSEDREDEGQYIFVNSAYFYKTSNIEFWKCKMINSFKEDTYKNLDYHQKILDDLLSMESEVNYKNSQVTNK